MVTPSQRRAVKVDRAYFARLGARTFLRDRVVCKQWMALDSEGRRAMSVKVRDAISAKDIEAYQALLPGDDERVKLAFNCL